MYGTGLCGEVEGTLHRVLLCAQLNKDKCSSLSLFN